MGGTKNKKKRTPTAPAVRAETPDESGGTEPEERSEDAASDSGRREADLREADSSLDLRSREKEIDRDRAAAFAKFERRQAREADDAGVDPKVAFQAEQRRRSSTSRAPDSVEAFAAFGSAPRRPVTGTPTAHATCCQCPHHCVLPDGTFRVVRSVAAHQALVPPEFDYCPGVSAKTLHAFKCYKAAVEDKGSSRDEIARLAQTFEVQRQADKERAMYYRLQDQESAMLAVTGYDDFDGDDDL